MILSNSGPDLTHLRAPMQAPSCGAYSLNPSNLVPSAIHICIHGITRKMVTLRKRLLGKILERMVDWLMGVCLETFPFLKYIYHNMYKRKMLPFGQHKGF